MKIILNIYKEITTENLNYSFFNLMNLKNIGHHISILKNKTKIEINIRDTDTSKGNGIIIYPDGNIYLGKIFLEKFKKVITTKTPNTFEQLHLKQLLL